MISLYDTLTSTIRPLAQRNPQQLSLYVCGPTVYDHPHLGHARSALTYDVLRRYLEWQGVKVRHVVNVTDIDDKIIKRAQQEGSTESQIAIKWEQVYFEIMEELNILQPHDRPHATEFIPEMVAFIEALISNGSAYRTASGVYLRVRSIADYGALVHCDFDELAKGMGARVEVDEHKEDGLDFALWKSAKPNEPTWPSPWGAGRPGWHIECVAMSLGILGDGFDLHGGGDDLIFPHHTNERAEAIAAGRTFANHWVHNAMLNVSGEKMAKSRGNYLTVRELLDEHPQNARALRLLLLQTHYRKTMEINAAVMRQARAGIERIDAMLRRATVDSLEVRDNETIAAFRNAMDNDLATPEAIAIVFDALRRANASFDNGLEAAAPLANTVVELVKVLGIAVDDESKPSTRANDSNELGSDVTALLERRSAAREAKNYAESDRLRTELNDLGILVEDTPTGTVWYRR